MMRRQWENNFSDFFVASKAGNILILIKNMIFKSWMPSTLRESVALCWSVQPYLSCKKAEVTEVKFTIFIHLLSWKAELEFRLQEKLIIAFFRLAWELVITVTYILHENLYCKPEHKCSLAKQLLLIEDFMCLRSKSKNHVIIAR